MDEVVVGDLIILTTGDKIPADGIIIEGMLSVDESIINGEAKETYKNTSSANNKVYRGTIVCSNEAIVKVTNIGSDTFYGKVREDWV